MRRIFAAAALAPLLSFILLSMAARLLHAEVVEYGDWMHIRATAVVSPCIDEYGRPTMNPDGTFYPNDMFKIGYIVEVEKNLTFEGVELDYDEKTFIPLDLSNWGGGLNGSGTFKVDVNADPGTYIFTVTAKANKTVGLPGPSGSITVTYGGVEVNAYYTAWCRLRISASGGGTTDPPPGAYWFKRGASVTVTAIPDANYTVDCWALDGSILPPSDSLTVKMDDPHDIEVYFVKANAAAPSNSTAASVSASSPRIMAAAQTAASQSSQSASSAMQGFSPASSTPLQRLSIGEFMWQTYFDFFRGMVCQAKGVLMLGGKPAPRSPVTVDFLKKNVVTGAMWISQVTVETDDEGRFVAEDACTPLFEAFLNAVAWAEKPGYLPTWRIRLYVNKDSGVVERGRLLIYGLRVDLEGRLSEVPVSLSVENLPQGCLASFNPSSGSVGLFRNFVSMGKIYASNETATGIYEVRIIASSGVERAAQSLKLTVKEFEVKAVKSRVSFMAYGIDWDAEGLILTLDAGADGEVKVNASMIPYSAAWRVDSTHTFMWVNEVGSEIDGKKYMFDRAEVAIHYIAVSKPHVTVVKYEPHFTLLLAYSVLNSTVDKTDAAGKTSFEKPLAFIIRYDGNGPDRNLRQRALIEDFSWEGWLIKGVGNKTNLSYEASKLAKFTNIRFLGNFFFHAIGLDETADRSQWILMVDGSPYLSEELPACFNWPAGSKHAYAWNIHVDAYDGGFFKPYLVTGEATEPSGTVNVSSFGGAVIAVYAKHKHPLLFLNPWERSGRVFLNWTRARVYYANGTIACAYEIRNNDPIPPILFQEDMRYALLIFRMDRDVMMRALEQNYTALEVHTHYITKRFTPTPVDAAYFNHTLLYEVFEQPTYIRAVKPAGSGGWAIDCGVSFNVTFFLGLNITEKDIYSAWFGNQTADPVAVKIALGDIYNPLPQWIAGSGEAYALLNKTSPHFYAIKALAEGHGRKTTLKVENVHVKFREDPYIIYINMVGGGVNASVMEDHDQYAKINFTALPEAGGIKAIRIYDGGRLIAERIFDVAAETQKGLFGFEGTIELAFTKNPGFTGSLTIEAENVWGATSTLSLRAEPYRQPPFIALLNQLAAGASALIIAVAIVTLILKWFRTRR